LGYLFRNKKGSQGWKKMMVSIAQSFIAAIAYGIGLLIAALQVMFLLVYLAFALVIGLIAFPIFFVKYRFFDK